MEVGLNIFGVREHEIKLGRLGKAAVHTKPALDIVASRMREVTGVQFTSQGRRGGGAWRRDTLPWLDRKLKMGLDPRILFASQRLYDSMVEKDNTEHYERVTDSEIEIGTWVEYAAAHQYGRPEANLPARPFLRFLAGDKMRWRKIIRDYCIWAYSNG